MLPYQSIAFCASLLAVGVTGCGSAENRPATQRSGQGHETSGPASPAASSAGVALPNEESPSDEDVVEESPSLELSPVRLVSERMRRERRGPVRISSRLSEADSRTLLVDISDYPGTCTPTPTFTASIDEGQLVLQEQAPSGPVARCTGFHGLRLKLHGFEAAGGSSIVIRGRDGEERARNTIR